MNQRPQKLQRFPVSTLSVQWGHEARLPGINQEAVSWPSTGTTVGTGPTLPSQPSSPGQAWAALAFLPSPRPAPAPARGEQACDFCR